MSGLNTHVTDDNLAVLLQLADAGAGVNGVIAAAAFRELQERRRALPPLSDKIAGVVEQLGDTADTIEESASSSAFEYATDEKSRASIINKGKDEADVVRKAADLLTRLSRAAPGEGWQAPDGWKLVPVVPSPEMHDAGGKAVQWFDQAIAKKEVPRYSVWDTAYRAMLASAPLPPAPTQEHGR